MPPRDLNIEYVSVVNERGEECAQQFDNSTGSLVGQPLRFPNASTRWTSATVRSREWRQERYTPSTAQPSSPLTPGPGQLLPLSREASEVNELRSDGRYSTPSQEGQVPGQIVNPNNPYGGRFIPQARTFSPTGRAPPTNWSDQPNSPVPGGAGPFVPRPGQVSQPSQSGSQGRPPLHSTLTEAQADQYALGLNIRYPTATQGQRWSWASYYRSNAVMTDPSAVAYRARQRQAAQAEDDDEDSE